MAGEPHEPDAEVADLPALLSAARRLGIVTAVDNTFATPDSATSPGFGADVVVHSATKFLAGHSDVLLGMALTSNKELYKAMRHHRITNGAIPVRWRRGLACAVCAPWHCAWNVL